jgi:pimeloyl-ACP methyl ester carboxylesterase
VLLHGFGASSFSWRHWTPELARRGHVVLVDLKGFGTAPHPPDDRYGPQDQAELVHRLLEELDTGPVTLVGHSLGGGIALLTALRLLDDPAGTGRLGRLALVAAAAYRQRMPPFVTLGRWPRTSRLLLQAVGTSNVVRWTLRSIVHDPDRITAGQVAGYAGPLEGAEAQRSLLRAAAQVVPPGLEAITPRYREIRVPTLLLWGREDPVVPLWVGRRLERALPRARLEILEGCGHAPMEEHPAASLGRVLGFVETTPTGPPPEPAPPRTRDPDRDR